MNSNYSPGDRVFTKIRGVEVEASVVRLSIDVEVKAPDGTVWWRAISKVRPVGAGVAPVSEQVPLQAAPPAEPVEAAVPPVTESPAATTPVAETPSAERRKKVRKRR